eukprot:CAMPEP_0117520550 /NCGR_PEP_ID=MMETSP0784-20121206/33224_1 /TAXON_ID=39447 /ORGANISM="" /LENGTH=342 /DNA_ID=CAMNT_0005316543 /DNA_START=1 /DNA_END=1029 /DNA_ORIENTATION=+
MQRLVRHQLPFVRLLARGPRSGSSVLPRSARPPRGVAAAAAPVAAFTIVALVASRPRARPHGQARCLVTRCDGGMDTATTAGATSLRFGFCGKPKKYTAIYEASPATNTASVNAGDYLLYVGGGSINLAFARALGLPNRKNAYQVLHEAMLEAAEATPGVLQRLEDVQTAKAEVAATAARELGLFGTFARVARGGRVGAAFLDVFDAPARPLNERNVAMLYVVGPKGQGAPGGHGPTVPGREDFLQAVEDMAANAMHTVCEYNLIAAVDGELPRVDTVQFCLVSGGVYRHPEASKFDVASATVVGLRSAVESFSSSEAAPVVRFAYDDHAFEDAVEGASSRL